MGKFSNTISLASALEKQGFELPKNCVDVELVMQPDAPFRLRYLVNVEDWDLIKIGRALEAIGSEKDSF